jgi:hypothetical protein
MNIQFLWMCITHELIFYRIARYFNEAPIHSGFEYRNTESIEISFLFWRTFVFIIEVNESCLEYLPVYND